MRKRKDAFIRRWQRRMREERDDDEERAVCENQEVIKLENMSLMNLILRCALAAFSLCPCFLSGLSTALFLSSSPRVNVSLGCCTDSRACAVLRDIRKIAT